MSIEAIAQVLLDQPLPRMTATEHDVFLKTRCNNIRDRRLPRLHLRRKFAHAAFPRSGRVRRSGLVSYVSLHVCNLKHNIVYNQYKAPGTTHGIGIS
jgi:hypothetical protein